MNKSQRTTKCYFPNCEEILTKKNKTVEHIPPKSFFPTDFKQNLMTVKSCLKHNNGKSQVDYYALQAISFNIIKLSKNINNDTFHLLLDSNEQLKLDLEKFKDEINTNKINCEKLDKFFDSLSYGIFFKKLGDVCDVNNYILHHIYIYIYIDFNKDLFKDDQKNRTESNPALDAAIINCTEFLSFYLNGKEENERNKVYMVKILGADAILNRKIKDRNKIINNITMVHEFYGGSCRVLSLFTKIPSYTPKKYLHTLQI